MTTQETTAWHEDSYLRMAQLFYIPGESFNTVRIICANYSDMLLAILLRSDEIIDCHIIVVVVVDCIVSYSE